MNKDNNKRSMITSVTGLLMLYILLMLKIFTGKRVGYSSSKLLDEMVSIIKGE